MLKLKTTKKVIREGYNTIINAGYCELQFLLKWSSPFAYTAGINGWQCDFYDINNICICTGYDTMHSKKHPSASYALCRKYDDLAKKEMDGKKVLELVNEFVKEAVKERSNGNK